MHNQNEGEGKMKTFDDLPNDQKGLINLMNAIHLDEWDKLPCPACENDLYKRIFTAIDFPLIGKYGL
jgi:hypothetical protein